VWAKARTACPDALPGSGASGVGRILQDGFEPGFFSHTLSIILSLALDAAIVGVIVLASVDNDGRPPKKKFVDGIPKIGSGR
jgi:hypothetical protein